MSGVFKWLIAGLVCMSYVQGLAQEICDNGIDDNNNGLVDLADPQCACFDSLVVVDSYVPDPSFEDMNSCPDFYSQLSYLHHWKQATFTTSDYFNTCGYTMPGLVNAGLTATDGNGFVGGHFLVEWKEYFGAQLLAPFVPGNEYTLTMDIALTGIEFLGEGCLLPPNLSPVKVSVFGTTHYSNFPLDYTTGCPTLQEADGIQDGSAEWVFLGDVLYTPSATWTTISISFVAPQGIKFIMIGPPCDLPPDYPLGTSTSPNLCSPYVVFDNIRVKESGYFTSPAPQLQIDKTGDCVGSDYVITAEQVPDAVYYWTTPEQEIVSGNLLSINDITEEQQGVYSVYYVAGECSSAVAYYVVEPAPGVPVSISPELFNIISPNGDGINDYLSGEDMVGPCAEYEIIIWNRWGNEIFRQLKGQAAFVGKNTLGNKVPTGAYFYSLRVNDKYHKQTLTVSY